jgi:hypothetical protein
MGNAAEGIAAIEKTVIPSAKPGMEAGPCSRLTIG